MSRNIVFPNMLFDYGFVVSYLAVGCLAQLFIVRILAGLTLTEWAGGTLTYDVGLEPPPICAAPLASRAVGHPIPTCFGAMQTVSNTFFRKTSRDARGTAPFLRGRVLTKGRRCEYKRGCPTDYESRHPSDCHGGSSCASRVGDSGRSYFSCRTSYHCQYSKIVVCSASSPSSRVRLVSRM